MERVSLHCRPVFFHAPDGFFLFIAPAQGRGG